MTPGNTTEQTKQYSEEKNAITHLLQANLREQRTRRRWGLFFKLAYLILFVIILLTVLPLRFLTTSKVSKNHVALIDITGPIFDSSPANADNIAQSLDAAFENKYTEAIILRINSPGGSPVQADYIYNEIHRLRELHKGIKVYAVCTDICASGAYYIAAAADDIYANPSSIVGSIGVLYDGFGFVGTMEKIGVERRLLTAGNHKGMLDPFSPMHKGDDIYIQDMLDQVHQTFIDRVKAGRGARLKINSETFSGLVWSGISAKKMGLIDGLGSAGYVAREVIKNDNIIDYTLRAGYLQRLVQRLGTSATQEAMNLLGMTSQHPLR